MGDRISAKSWWIAVAAVAVAGALILLAMGRPPICPCGYVTLWHGTVQSSQNSQQLSDWYSFSHITHGFLFYWAGWWLMRRQPVGLRLLIAASLESGWEILENSPLIIDRYRAVTMAYGYSGDSVINSLSDICCMIAGFTIARKLPWWGTLSLGIAFELFTLWAIRDNLTLNLWMLIAPSDTIRAWQAG